MDASENSQVENSTEHGSGVVEVEKAYSSEATSEAVAVEKDAEPEAAAESLDAELSVPPSNAVVGSEAPEPVYQVPRCGGDDQPATRASWMNCCGLLDAVRG